MAGRFSKLERGDGKTAPLAPPPGSVAREKPKGETVNYDDPSLYPSFIAQADEAFFTGNYRDALRNYSRALQQESNHVYPWIGQISSLIMLRQPREAELWSQRALEHFPEDPALLSQRARVLAMTGNIKRALGVSDYALTKGSDCWAWLARGEVLLDGKKDSALFCFEKAVEEAGPENWRVPFLAGLAFSRHRQYSTAQDFLRRATDVNPNNFFVWYEYGRVLMELSYLDRARDALARAAQLNPEFKPARDLQNAVRRRPLLKRVFGMLRR